MRCSGCFMNFYKEQLHTYHISEYDDEKELFCEMCCEFYLTSSVNFEFFKKNDIQCTSDYPFTARMYGQTRFFNLFVKLTKFVLKENTQNYLCTFGRGSLHYFSHFTTEQTIDDLKEFQKECINELWHNLREKTPENTLYFPTEHWKEKRGRELNEEINERELKRNKFLLSLD
jgi:hypothetical protein